MCRLLSLAGRRETAPRAARRIDADVPDDFLRDYAPLADGLMPTTLHVMIRFGMWEEILRHPEDPSYRLVSRAMRHYAPGVALAALGRRDQVHWELEQFDAVVATVTDEWFTGNNGASTVLGIARRMMAGEIAYREGRREDAFTLLREAVMMEDELVYDEPPGWMQPCGVTRATGGRWLDWSTRCVPRAAMMRRGRWSPSARRRGTAPTFAPRPRATASRRADEP